MIILFKFYTNFLINFFVATKMNIGGANAIIRRRTIDTHGKQQHIVVEQRSAANQLNLNMYLEPEMGTVTLEEFQAMGTKRLAVLKMVERLRERHGSNLEEYREAFKQVKGCTFVTIIWELNNQIIDLYHRCRPPNTGFYIKLVMVMPEKAKQRRILCPH